MFVDIKESGLDSSRIKSLLFNYFRFQKKFLGVLSEYYNKEFNEVEDFVAFNFDCVIVVEIKTSKNDFIRDFNKSKHEFLKEWLNNQGCTENIQGENSQRKKNLKPYFNKFYFCITKGLEDFVKDFVETSANYAGILVAHRDYIIKVREANMIKKKADFLEDRKFVKRLILRMSSELAGFWFKNKTQSGSLKQ